MLGREHLLRRPSLFESRAECSVSDTKPTRPLSQAMRFSVVFQKSCFTGVLSLLHSSRPFAVRRPTIRHTLIAMSARIIPVVVDPLNAVFSGRFLPNVCHEIDERVSPLMTHLNRSLPVTMVVLIVRVVAASFHLLPRRILGRFAHATSTCSVASARLSRTLSKIPTSYCSLIPTLAKALPAGIARLGFSRKLNYCELAVNVANFVRSLFAATAGTNSSIAQSTPAHNGFFSAFAAAVPACTFQSLEIATSVTQNGKLSVSIASLIFDVRPQLARIVRRHSSTPDKLDCVRAESVHHDCLGSFHCTKQGRLVHYI